MDKFYDQNAAKKSANLSINSDLLKQAKELNINLSATFEQALISQLKANQAQVWRQKNRAAIAVYNSSVEEMGVFSDGFRSF